MDTSMHVPASASPKAGGEWFDLIAEEDRFLFPEERAPASVLQGLWNKKAAAGKDCLVTDEDDPAKQPMLISHARNAGKSKPAVSAALYKTTQIAAGYLSLLEGLFVETSPTIGKSIVTRCFLLALLRCWSLLEDPFTELPAVTVRGAKAILKQARISEERFLSPRYPAIGRLSLLPVDSHRRTQLAFLFGGQGSNYIEELRGLMKDERVLSFIRRMSVVLTTQGNKVGLNVDFYRLLQLSDDEETNWSWAPLSYPLIALTQLARFVKYCNDGYEGLDAALKIFSAKGSSVALGHSQGVMSAVVVSLSTESESFNWNSEQAMKLLLWIGYYSQKKYDALLQENAPPKGHRIDKESSPMLSFAKVSPREIQKIVVNVNECLPASAPRVTLSIVNGTEACVVTGLPQVLEILRSHAHSSLDYQPKIPEGTSESRVPYSQRKRSIYSSFLDASVPFHSNILNDVVSEVVALAKKESVDMDSRSLTIPVLSTKDGSDLREFSGKNFLEAIVRLQVSTPMDWCAVCDSLSRSTDGRNLVALDFGPSTAASLLAIRYLRGQGCSFVGMATEVPIRYDGAPGKRMEDVLGQVSSVESLELSNVRAHNFSNHTVVAIRNKLWDVIWDYSVALAKDSDTAKVALVPSWTELFGPMLYKTADGESRISTKFTRLLRRPPVLVAGMTPTTNDPRFVRAIANAGFHGELGTGALVRNFLFHDTVQKLNDFVVPGPHGVHLNLLFLNAKLWAFQFPAVIDMVKDEGIAIDSICIAAGVPSQGKAFEILEGLQSAGIKIVAFKPGSTEAIKLVLDIAKDHPQMTILLEWTGGRSGGHHSFEDAHEPLLKTYSDIRAVDNVVLIFGGGVGDSDSAWLYLSGAWSQQDGASPMPVDAVIMGSRLMVAMEAPTAEPVKDLIVKTEGVPVEREQEWEKSYTSDAGGVITVESELGEPIHVIGNRGMLLWRELDQKFFSVKSKDSLQTRLRPHRHWLIQRLNADYQKVYFPFKFHENKPCESIDECTYEDVLRRMAQLMFRGPVRRWIHPTFISRFIDFCNRTSERFGCSLDTAWAKKSCMHDPSVVIDEVLTTCPRAKTSLLLDYDADFFISICKTGGKPVNFIPALDDDFKFWFKKDSLWYAEDLEGTIDGDAERVMILQGPVACYYSKSKDLSAGEILSSIYQGMVDKLADTKKEALSSPPVPVSVPYDEVPTLANFTTTIMQSGSPDAMVQKFLSAVDISAEDRRIIMECAAEAMSVDASPTKIEAVHQVVSTAEKEGAFRKSDSDEPEEASKTEDSEEESVPAHPRLPTTEDDNEEWLTFLSTLNPNWTVAAFKMKFYIALAPVGWRRPRNPVIDMFKLKQGQDWIFLFHPVHGLAGILISEEGQPKVMVVRREEDVDNSTGRKSIPLTLLVFSEMPGENSSAADFSLSMSVTGDLSDEFAPPCLYMDAEERARASAALYRKLWAPAEAESGRAVLLDEVFQSEVTVEESAVLQYLSAIKAPNDSKVDISNASVDRIPLDFAIVVGWEPLMKGLFAVEFAKVDLTKLVHLSNSFKSVGADRAILLKAFLTEQDAFSAERLTDVISDMSKAHKHNLDRLIFRSQVVRNARFQLKLGHSYVTLARVVEARAETGGTVVRVRGLIFESGKESSGGIEVESSFMIRSPVMIPFKKWIKDMHVMKVNSPSRALTLLSGKLWCRLQKETRNLSPQNLFAILIRYEVDSSVRKEVTIHTSGVVYSQSEDEVEVEAGNKLSVIGAIHCEGKGVDRDPVVDFFSRHGKDTADTMAMRDSEANYNVLSTPPSVAAPGIPDIWKYSCASGDANPIHSNPYFAPLADLDSVIVHGMWVSAAVRGLVEKERILNNDGMWYYNVQFIDKVLPESELFVQVTDCGRMQGSAVLRINVVDGGGRLVVQAVACVYLSTSAYVFTGQGSAEVGMGMELYGSSSAAKKIWDAAEAYMTKKFGVSILTIVKNNPKKWEVSFEGSRGKELLRNYMALITNQEEEIVDTTTGERKKVQVEKPLIAGINEHSERHVFYHEEGLLFATQFTQPALMLMEKATFADLVQKGIVDKEHLVFAGHSLGEYSALASAGEIGKEDLVELCFVRGLSMQGVVPRHRKTGASPYGMIALNPSRVHPLFTEDLIHVLVKQIASTTDHLIQVVNYNVRSWQYVVAGHRDALELLAATVDAAFIHIMKSLEKKDPSTKDTTSLGTTEFLAFLKHASTVIAKKKVSAFKDALVKADPDFAQALSESDHAAIENRNLAHQKMNKMLELVKEITFVDSDGYPILPLTRSNATIPLPGIDVPFHSAFLKPGVPAFRTFLLQKIPFEDFQLHNLIGRYIPNVNARVFDITPSFVDSVYRYTESEEIKKLMEKSAFLQGNQKRENTPLDELRLIGHTLLIELLAYQFASPVQWIKTQDMMFSAKDDGGLGVSTFIEIGPAATLTRMFERTMMLRKSGVKEQRRGSSDKSILKHALAVAMGSIDPSELSQAVSIDDGDARFLFLGKATDRAEIYAAQDDMGPSAQDHVRALLSGEDEEEDDGEASDDVPAPVVHAPVAPMTAPPMQMAPASMEAPPVSGLKAVERIQMIIAAKLSAGSAKGDRTVSSTSESVKSISKGKSALQNEILGEIGAEFGKELPEGAAEKDILSLAKEIGGEGEHDGGKVVKTLVSTLFKAKMPQGFKYPQAEKYLKDEYGISSSTAAAAALSFLIFNESAQRLPDAAAAQQLLDKAVVDLAQSRGLSPFPKAGSAPAAMSMPMAGMPMAMSGPPKPVAIPSLTWTVKTFLVPYLSAKFQVNLDELDAAVAGDGPSVKELSKGKSALQNEVLGEIGAELKVELPEGAGEMKLSKLLSSLSEVAQKSNYAAPGKVVQGSLSTGFSATQMPSGFGRKEVEKYLKERGLESNRIACIMMESLSPPLAPTKAVKASKEEAKSWIDKAFDRHAAKNGIDLSAGASGGAMAVQSMGMMPAVNNVIVQGSKKAERSLYELYTSLRSTLGVSAAEEEVLLNSRQKDAELSTLTEEKTAWLDEHGGEKYVKGLAAVFDPKKVREYSSSWAWGAHFWRRVVALLLDIIEEENDDEAILRTVKGVLDSAIFKMTLNRTTPQVLRMMSTVISKLEESSKCTGAVELLEEKRKELEKELSESSPSVLPPFEFSGSSVFTGYREAPQAVREIMPAPGPVSKPYTFVSKDGKVKYSEEDRLQHEICAYLESLFEVNDSSMSGVAMSPALVVRKANLGTPLESPVDDLGNENLRLGLESLLSGSLSVKNRVALVTGAGPGAIASEVVRMLLSGGATVIVTTSRPLGTPMCNPGDEFDGRFRSGVQRWEEMYRSWGANGSRLIVCRYNAASRVDLKGLIKFVMSSKKEGGLGISRLDLVLPFAAISEVGRDVTSIDQQSLLAQRAMVNNVVQMVGEIVTWKRQRRVEREFQPPTVILLPLSPNIGFFGGDGLYGEHKLALQSLLYKGASEGWSDVVSVLGFIIGWTRGTSLMEANNLVASEMERRCSIRTFSTTEIAAAAVATLYRHMLERVTEGDTPLVIDMSGGLGSVRNVGKIVADIRKFWDAKAAEKREGLNEEKFEKVAIANGYIKGVVESDNERGQKVRERKRSITNNFSGPVRGKQGTDVRLYPSLRMPQLPSQERLSKLRGRGLSTLIDLKYTPVIVGFGELGPYGLSHTRWEIEKGGVFSMEGCVELAWLCGLIDPVKDSGKGREWKDKATGEVIKEAEVKKKYEDQLLSQSGIRPVEPALFAGYNPANKSLLAPVMIDRDLGPLDIDGPEEAHPYVIDLGEDKVIVQEITDVIGEHGEPGEKKWQMTIKAGSVLYIPKALAFDRKVAAQIPTGFDATRYGLPQNLVDSMDDVTVFVIVATAEALIRSGITDTYEMYHYIHVSEVGNTIGGGMGGSKGLKGMFQSRKFEQSARSDVLQDTLINVVPAWVNMLMLSAAGPIKTLVGACATAAESIDVACSTIKSGDARLVVAGAGDDFNEEFSYEFAQMKATVSSDDEVRRGRGAREMSRPMTTTRNGFMEGHGAGIVIIADAALALEMGLPIYAVIAGTHSACDKVGRSVPAPGQGILTSAKERRQPNGKLPLSLSLEYRRQRVLKEVAALKESILGDVNIAIDGMENSDVSEEIQQLYLEWEVALAATKRKWGHDFFVHDDRISKLRGSLAVWGLTVDDLAVASFHGTSTKANDTNESEVTQLQMEWLGRKKGLPIAVVSQKWLTGHPKGPAAAWMLNGLLQCMNESIVPGNRNADNIEEKLRAFDQLFFSHECVKLEGYMEAAIMKSFGFGQAGAEIILVHPDHLLACVSEVEYAQYARKQRARQMKADREWNRILNGRSHLVKVKEVAPYGESKTMAKEVYLNGDMRAGYDKETDVYDFMSSGRPAAPFDEAPSSGMPAKAKMIEMMADSTAAKESLKARLASTLATSSARLKDGNVGIGIDFEPWTTFSELPSLSQESESGSLVDETWRAKYGFTFTEREVALCMKKAMPSASFAGRWACKEAAVKALTDIAVAKNKQQVLEEIVGPKAKFTEIEVLESEAGSPVISLHGKLSELFQALSLNRVAASISHDAGVAVAQVVVME